MAKVFAISYLVGVIFTGIWLDGMDQRCRIKGRAPWFETLFIAISWPASLPIFSQAFAWTETGRWDGCKPVIR